jgi:hypothetical protein
VPGGASDHTPGPGVHAPYWVKLERIGNIFTGYVSANGQKWEKVGDASIDMNSDALIGIAVTAHNNAALCNATFDGVKVEAGAAAR